MSRRRRDIVKINNRYGGCKVLQTGESAQIFCLASLHLPFPLSFFLSISFVFIRNTSHARALDGVYASSSPFSFTSVKVKPFAPGKYCNGWSTLSITLETVNNSFLFVLQYLFISYCGSLTCEYPYNPPFNLQHSE